MERNTKHYSTRNYTNAMNYRQVKKEYQSLLRQVALREEVQKIKRRILWGKILMPEIARDLDEKYHINKEGTKVIK